MAINLNGNAESTFLSDVDIGSGNIELNADGTASFNNGEVSIDSDGRLLIGVAPSASLDTSKLVVEGQTTNASAGANFKLQRGEAPADIAGGDGLGSIQFCSNDGNRFAQIAGQADGAAGADDYPGRLLLLTTADGESSPTERMRITSGGEIYFNTAAEPDGTTTWGAGFTNESNKRAILKTATNTTNSNTLIAFFNPNGGIGTIKTSGSSTSYNTSSDYRLKENVVPLIGVADRLKKLKPSKFNFIADPDTTVEGFLAHEVQAVVPECATGTKDEVDDQGNPVYQGIDQSKLVPLLTAALQEALTRIEALEAKVQQLEGGAN